MHEPLPERGRNPIDNRTVFTLPGFRLKAGVGWPGLPIEMGVNRSTVRRRFNEWTKLDCGR